MKNFAFIDSQNLNLGTKSTGWTMDYGKFRLYLRNKYKVRKAYLFIGYIEKNQKLYSQLEKQGYTLIYKNVLGIKKSGKLIYKGNVDAELVMHSILEKPNYDKAIIVSGDGDFYCLIEHLESEDKLIKIITPNHRFSSLLRKYNSFILPLTNLKSKLRK